MMMATEEHESETVQSLSSPEPEIEDITDEQEVQDEPLDNNLNDSSTTATGVASAFWQEGAYKKVTKRIEDGARVLEDLSKMMHERAEIENLYASKLKVWEKKWLEALHRSSEYGSIVEGIEKLLGEGTSISDLHFSVHGKLENMSKEMLQWKAHKYPKSLTKYKELRRSEEAFGKAQGPWLTKYKEAQKWKKNYHTAKDLQRCLKEQEKELKTDTSETTQEQLNKIETRMKKNESEVENSNKKYENAIRDISTYNQKYIGDMSYEFNACQNFEKVRREKVKEKLEQLISCLDRKMFFENYNVIYSEIESVIKNMDIENDLNWYCSMYGPDESLFKPLEFIEYDPFVHSMNTTNTKGVGNGNSPLPKKKGSSSVCTAL